MSQPFQIVWIIIHKASLRLSSDHYCTHDDVGKAFVGHVHDVAGVKDNKPHDDRLDGLAANPFEDLGVWQQLVVGCSAG